MRVYRRFAPDRRAVLYRGDCRRLLQSVPDSSIDLTITSPPYCMGRPYEDRQATVEDFVSAHEEILPEIVRVTKPTGNICWQVGYHVTKSRKVTPLDSLVHGIADQLGLGLRNRIIWAFGHGLHSRRRFSGRHEVVMWYTLSDDYYFDLDSVRIPHKYPGKKATCGPRKGQPSGNPKGKNPEDVWQIPNVRANHVEKTDHPCQFPIGLAQRLVRAMSPLGGLVLDPFAGTAATGAAALIEGRSFVGAEIDPSYCEIADDRLRQAVEGNLAIRDVNEPSAKLPSSRAVMKKPEHFEY